MEETAKLAKNDSINEDLLYTKTNYYYTFGLNTQGDACFRKLILQYKEKKNYEKVDECYKNLISIARKANNAALMGRTYENYIVWTDSVKALTAQDELNVLKRKYDESLQRYKIKMIHYRPNSMLSRTLYPRSHSRRRIGTFSIRIATFHGWQPKTKKEHSNSQ